MEIKEMVCELTIKKDGETVNKLIHMGEKALLDLAEAYRALNPKTRFNSVERCTRTCHPYNHETTITTKFNNGFIYAYKFNFNDKTDF